MVVSLVAYFFLAHPVYREFHYHIESFHLREAVDWGFKGGL